MGALPRSAGLGCAVLCCAVLCCAVLRCAALYCTGRGGCLRRREPRGAHFGAGDLVGVAQSELRARGSVLRARGSVLRARGSVRVR